MEYPNSTFLLKNCRIINPFGSPTVIPNGYIHIQKDTIIATGSGSLPDNGTIIDLGGRTVLPGMINAHTHLYSALALGMPPPNKTPRNFTEILERIWWPLDRALDRESNRASFAVGLLDHLKHGVTTVIDHHSSPNDTRGILTELAQLANQLGMTLSAAFEITDRNGPERFQAGLEENLRFYQETHNTSTVRPLVGLHASFTLSDPSLEAIAEAVKRLPDGGIHIHVSEDQADEKDARDRGYRSVVDRLHHFGLLNRNSLVIHGVHLNREDLPILKTTGAMLVHNPTSNANNRVGLTPGKIVESLHSGLGTDGMQANLLQEAREGNLIRSSHLACGAPNIDLLRALFVNNPRIATHLFGKKIGRLEPGYQADLAIYDYHPRTAITEENWPAHLLYGFDLPSDVMACGVFRIRDREWVDIPAETWLESGRIQSQRLWRFATKDTENTE
ncbi:MAG: amidohydrolase family protein [FCB group bacterium]|nr:amidohydrolase family protein [FCB group bacterium]